MEQKHYGIVEFILKNQVNILPVLMAITSIVHAKMQPKSPDPQQRQQQVMMMYMPVFFAFILYGFPSGLTLYWTLSTAISLLEQWLIRRTADKIKATPLKAKEVSPRKAKLMKAIQDRQRRWERRYGKR